MNDVIIIGTNHHNTLSVIRALGFEGIRPKLLVICDSKHPYVAHSRYISYYQRIDSIDDISNCLAKKFIDNNNKPIIISCSDAISSHIDLNYDFLKSKFVLPGSSKQGQITELMDKATMAKLAVESGLFIPESASISTDCLDEKFVENLKYPVITKPLKSIAGSKDDIHIITTPSELLAKKSSFKCQNLQIQHFIEKEFEFQLIGCSLEGGDKVIIPGASIILRQPDNTNTGFLRYVPLSQISPDVDACTKFLKAAGYSGLFSMEFIRGKDGNDYFMETNFRNDGNAICVTAAGINLPYIWVKYNLGGNVTDYLNENQVKEVFVMPEFSDFKNVLSRKISLWKWLKDIKRTDAFMDWCKSDQRPFWYYLPSKIANKLF